MVNTFFVPPLEKKDFEKAYEMASEQDYEVWSQTGEAVEKALGNFWGKPPRERLEFYGRHEPVTMPAVQRAEQAMQAALEAAQKARETAQPTQPMNGMMPMPVAPEAMAQQAAVQAEVSMAVEKAQAELDLLVSQGPAALTAEVLSPYWQLLWDMDPKETEKMIRDFKNLAKGAGL